jgi:hypothetical protein
MIYFVGNKDIGRVKIGFTGDIRRRFSTIKMHSPVELEIFLFINGTQKYEKSLHEKFAKHKKHGEWFDLCPEIIAFIEQHKKVDISNLGTITDDIPTILGKAFICQYCKEQVDGSTCDVCGKKLKNMCRECHLEVDHNKVVIEKEVSFPCHPGPIDIDSDGSWANTVRAYEE